MEFREILVEVIKKTSVVGKRAVIKDIALYIFGVPISLLFLKQACFGHYLRLLNERAS